MNSDRDNALARQMGRALRDMQDMGGADCPDADVLAAYYERRMATAEVAAAERHLADCGRCQAQLAAIARSEPVPVSASSKWGWIVGSRALVPLATAALTVILLSITTFQWLELRTASPIEEPGSSPPEAIVAERDAPAASDSTDRYTLARPSAAPASPAAPRDRRALDENLTREKTGSDEKDRTANKTLAPPVALSDRVDPSGGRKAAKKEQSSEAPAVAPAPPHVVDAAAAQAAENQQTAPTSAARAESRANDRHAQPSASLSMRLQKQSLIVRTPAPQVWVRLGPGQAIWRTDDAGANWREAVSDLPSEPLAVAAPSAGVIWVVGREGLIRLADGGTWRAIAAPVREDLVRVDAQDERRARIFTADAKAFATKDGGASWIALPER